MQQNEISPKSESESESETETEKTIPEKWINEIIRETEHYYQGEIQQEQRASWFLALSAGLFAVMLGTLSDITERGSFWLTALYGIGLLDIVISIVFAVITTMPLMGTRAPKLREFQKRQMSDGRSLSAEELLVARFRNDNDWTDASLQRRVTYHFRSHFIRNRVKTKWVYWSSIFIAKAIGMCFIVIMVLASSPPAQNSLPPRPSPAASPASSTPAITPTP